MIIIRIRNYKKHWQNIILIIKYIKSFINLLKDLYKIL